MRFDTLLREQEVEDAAASRWWLFLLTGVAWLVFALAVFQWDYTTGTRSRTSSASWPFWLA